MQKIQRHGIMNAPKYMSQGTLEIYNALLNIGIAKESAEKVSQLFVNLEEATKYATKSDIQDIKTDIKVINSRLQTITALCVGILITAIASVLFT